jgi:hypothetical protein
MVALLTRLAIYYPKSRHPATMPAIPVYGTVGSLIRLPEDFFLLHGMVFGEIWLGPRLVLAAASPRDSVIALSQ